MVAQYAAQTHRGWCFSNFGDRLQPRAAAARNGAALAAHLKWVTPGERQYDVVVVGGESGQTYRGFKALEARCKYPK
jgi:hypothetical protein